MRSMELAVNSAGKIKSGTEGDHELISSLAGKQADRESAVAHRTRRVVMASLGVMQEQKAGRKRSAALAVAGVLMGIFLLAPTAWRVAEDLRAGEHFYDITTQFSLWFGLFCLALVAAVLLAGWARHKF